MYINHTILNIYDLWGETTTCPGSHTGCEPWVGCACTKPKSNSNLLGYVNPAMVCKHFTVHGTDRNLLGSHLESLEIWLLWRTGPFMRL